MVDLTQLWGSIFINQCITLILFILSVWVMYCGYCVHEYHIYITFTDEALPQDPQNPSTRKVLDCILTGSCSSQTKQISSNLLQNSSSRYFKLIIYLSCLVVYPIVLYYIMTRADTTKYGRFTTAMIMYLNISAYNFCTYH